jgi:Glycosyltransferase
LFEGLPVALAEAMYKSKPCIVSRIGVFEEIMIDKENGILIDPHSVRELSEAMVELYQDKSLRQTLGDRGYETAVSSFDAATTAKLWEELYARIASK